MNKHLAKIFFIISIILIPLSLIAQNEKIEFGKTYNTKVYFSNRKTVKGIIYLVNDSSIILSNTKSGKLYFDTIPFNRINKILLTKKGNGGIGFAIGAGASIVTGIIIGLGENDEENRAQYMLVDIMLGVLFSPIVGIVGAVIGSSNGKLFHIDSNMKNFNL